MLILANVILVSKSYDLRILSETQPGFHFGFEPKYMKTLKLDDNLYIPQLGFGTWMLLGDECVEGVKKALETDYRHIDTADKYGNHKEVGKAIRESGIDRKEIFLTTKVWTTNLNEQPLKNDANRFLEELDTDYIDLLLIHWPNRQIPIEETLDAMNDLRSEGLIRSIGVSNFTEKHIEKALKTGVKIVNNQVEIHPTFAQNELVEYCQKNGITVTAYSPLGRGADLGIPIIQDIAKKHSSTEAQIIIAWLLSRDLIVIPKATSPERIEENYKSSEIKLSEEDIEKINSLDKVERLIAPAWNEF